MSENIVILIVDDDYFFNVDVLTYKLRQMGYNKIINAFTMEEFKEKAALSDIVVLDIRLPKKSGAPIDPWGGLKALDEMISSSTIDEKTKKTLSRVIIRSVQKIEDARKINIPIPPQYRCWLPVDVPLSEILEEIQALESMMKDEQ